MTVLAHVDLVWLWHFERSLARALAKGLAGFILFHTALALIVSGVARP